MAAEDEAMVVYDVSVQDPDNEDYIRVDIWAEKGNVSLPSTMRGSIEIERGIGEDGEMEGSWVVVGKGPALNEVLAGLVYYPPQDWTSFQQVRKISCGRRYAFQSADPLSK